MIRLPPRSTSTANLVPYTTRFRSGRKLSITAGEDGRILPHCFSCGDAAAIVQAAGLTIADLFPERLAADTHEDRQRRRRLAREAQWGAALEVVQHEARVVPLAAGAISYGRPGRGPDYTRLREAGDELASPGKT